MVKLMQKSQIGKETMHELNKTVLGKSKIQVNVQKYILYGVITLLILTHADEHWDSKGSMKDK